VELAWSCFTWLLYIALEPYVRRRWPATLVSWSRVLAGFFRDPVVGRDILIGCFLGAFTTAVERPVWFVPSLLGYPPPQPSLGPLADLLGTRMILSDTARTLDIAPSFWLTGLFVLFLFRALLRNERTAAVAFVLLLTGSVAAASGLDPVASVGVLIWASLAVFVLIRFGLLALVANYVVL
jgi:hypothetical protein